MSSLYWIEQYWIRECLPSLSSYGGGEVGWITKIDIKSHDLNEAILHYSFLGAGSRAENGPEINTYVMAKFKRQKSK